MTKPNRLNESPSQTAGPYVHIGCAPNFCGIGMYEGADFATDMINKATLGERITITGTITDGDDALVKDALLEIWQADANGVYASPEDGGEVDPNFTGFGRCPTNLDTGIYRFETVKPGVTKFNDNRDQAPHITMWIVARGINLGLQTRIYFPDEDNSRDPLLSAVPDDRRQTMIATKTGDGEYQFNIRLQGTDETVFLDI